MHGTEASSCDNAGSDVASEQSAMACPSPWYCYGSSPYPTTPAADFLALPPVGPCDGILCFVPLTTAESRAALMNYLPSAFSACCLQDFEAKSTAGIANGFCQSSVEELPGCETAAVDAEGVQQEGEGEVQVIGEESKDKTADEKDASESPQPLMLKPFYNYFHRIPSENLGRPVFFTTRRTRNRHCVYDAWKEYMFLLFRNLPDIWELKVAKPNYKPATGWLCYKDFAKVRFACKICRTGWTSMCGVVIFSFRWNWKWQQGQILHHIMGQKCGVCNPNNFELPIWYPEEAQKIMTNLYYKICSEVYGLKTPHFIRARRSGSSLSSHNGKLCQGCIRGICLTKCHTN